LRQAESEITQIIFICAGTNGRFSLEDTLCAGAFISAIYRKNQDYELTDSAHAAKNLYNMHIIDLKDFLSQAEHAKYLQSIGMGEDIETCLTFDKYPVVPLMNGTGFKKFTFPEI
jgi:2-phosphosulfolactate phosphatase